jgi:hypothetical protein
LALAELAYKKGAEIRHIFRTTLKWYIDITVGCDDTIPSFTGLEYSLAEQAARAYLLTLDDKGGM